VIVGIDYGSKMAGTTAICYLKEDRLSFSISQKNQDADQFIVDFITQLPSKVGIYLDAPLSLPGVYRGLPSFQDYFYRESDKAVKAMSPMFLGGLTARAMKLTTQLEAMGHSVFEAYPGAFARNLDLKKQGYKGAKEEIPKVLERLQESYQVLILPTDLPSWHEVDALIAFLIGCSHQEGKATVVGNVEEGVIYY
jgi:predicted nuclease with RNAse H fold